MSDGNQNCGYRMDQAPILASISPYSAIALQRFFSMDISDTPPVMEKVGFGLPRWDSPFSQYQRLMCFSRAP